MWDAKTGTMVRMQKGHKGAVTCLAYSSTSKLLFSSSIDSTIGIWTDKGILLQVGRPGVGPGGGKCAWGCGLAVGRGIVAKGVVHMTEGPGAVGVGQATLRAHVQLTRACTKGVA